MTLRDIKDFIAVFEDSECDDYEIILWDYNHQQKLKTGGGYSLSHPDKEITIPVDVPPVDGVTIFERLKQLQDGIQKENKR